MAFWLTRRRWNGRKRRLPAARQVWTLLDLPPPPFLPPAINNVPDKKPTPKKAKYMRAAGCFCVLGRMGGRFNVDGLAVVHAHDDEQGQQGNDQQSFENQFKIHGSFLQHTSYYRVNMVP